MARLTEEQVHQACKQITERGEKPTSLVLLKELGFGSLSTITKYLKSYEEANKDREDDLPRVVELSPDLLKVGEDAVKKIWVTASEIATAELEIQRTALDTAQKEANTKVEEALAFSDAQTQKIDDLEQKIEDLLNANSELIENKVTNEKHASEIEAKLASITEKNTALLANEEKLSIENKALYSENSRYKGQIDNLEKEKTSNLLIIKELNTSIGKLNAERDALEVARNDDKTAYKREIEKMEANIAKITKERENAIRELSQYKDKELQESRKVNSSYLKLVSKVEELQEKLEKTIRERDTFELKLRNRKIQP